MKIIIAGGTGFLGGILMSHFSEHDDIVILTRKSRPSEKNVRYVQWDGEHVGNWKTELNGAEAIINLNGKSVDCRYTSTNKKQIYDSRLKATAALGKAIMKSQHPPKLWINASSATIYRYSEAVVMTEASSSLGNGFSEDVCKRWEKTFYEFNLPKTRQIALRVGLVLGKSGGALQGLSTTVRMGLGGTHGHGRQMMSWVHQDDFARAVLYLMEHENLKGTFNLTSPNPIPDKIFMHQLRKAMGMPFSLPLPSWMIYLGAFIMNTEPELILKSRYVYPRRLIDAGFTFKYPQIEKAFENLLQE